MAIRPEIPIILCTGCSRRISEDGALRKGIKALVDKAFVRKQLADSVRRMQDGTL